MTDSKQPLLDATTTTTTPEDVSESNDVEARVLARGNEFIQKRERDLKAYCECVWRDALMEAESRGHWYVVINTVDVKSAVPMRVWKFCGCDVIQFQRLRYPGTRVFVDIKTCLFLDEACAEYDPSDVTWQRIRRVMGDLTKDKWEYTWSGNNNECYALIFRPKVMNIDGDSVFDYVMQNHS